jgi:hypothetical protein
MEYPLKQAPPMKIRMIFPFKQSAMCVQPLPKLHKVPVVSPLPQSPSARNESFSSLVPARVTSANATKSIKKYESTFIFFISNFNQ